MLDEGSVISYLNERGLISGNATVEVLTGGVSCVVLAVKSAEREIVVKQALPELKTKAKWVADQRRAIVEAEAMQVYQSITPDSVPELIDCDQANFTLTMSRLPNTCTNWSVCFPRRHRLQGGRSRGRLVKDLLPSFDQPAWQRFLANFWCDIYFDAQTAGQAS